MRTRRAIRLTLLLALLAAAPLARATVFDNVPEATNDGYQLVYTLPIPNSANFRNTNPIPYSYDASGSIGYFDRIAYYLELDTGTGLEYVYASMDAFTHSATQIGLPHNVNNPVAWQQIVNNMNVVSNKPGIVTGTGITTGNLEMWPGSYSGNTTALIPTGTSTHDWNDTNTSGTGAGHGSFQVHNYGANGTGQTLIGYSDWGGNNAGGNSELGIGTNTGTVQTLGGPVSVGGSPDWTFADSTNLYTVKNLQILVRPAGIPTAPANIVANVPEASTFTVVYQLPIQNAAFNPIQYAQNNAAFYPDSSFDRVAYYLELQHPTYGSQFVYVSVDPFTAQANQLGVPQGTAYWFQQFLSNMNVISDVGSIVNGTGITTGNIEFWGYNYSAGNALPVPGASGSTYDFGDTRSTSGNYGSMQIHNYAAAQTLFAYNHWNTGTPCLGIGNNPVGGGNPDWTFNETANLYTVKNLWVLAHIAGALLQDTPGTGSLLDFGHDLFPYTPVTLVGGVTLENIGTTNSIIDVTGYDITGPDAAYFDVTNFTLALLQADYADTVQYDVEFFGGGLGRYSALLTFYTSEGNVTYDLSARAMPEPTTCVILLMGMAACARRRRRASR